MTQAGDDALDCPAINRQIADNQTAAATLLGKDKQVERANTAKTVAAALPYIGLLMMASADLSNTEQVEARALIDRNERLTYIAKQKGCKA